MLGCDECNEDYCASCTVKVQPQVHQCEGGHSLRFKAIEWECEGICDGCNKELVGGN